MAVLDNLLQLFAQRDMRKAVAGQRTGQEAMQPQAPAQMPSLMNILGPQADPRRAAALGAGQGLLANTPGTEGLAGAIGGARDAVAEVMAARRQAALEAQAAALQAQQDAARNSVLQKYVGRDDLDAIQGLSAELVSLGDDRSLKMAEHLKPLLESLKVDKDRATVEGDSAYKTALSEFAVETTGSAANIHELLLKPADAMRVNQRADMIRRMGASTTSVNLNTPTPEKQLGPAVAAELVNMRKSAEAAMRVVGLTDESTRLLNSGIYSGRLAPSIEKVAGALDAMGLLSAAGTNKLSATQEYLSNTAETVLAEVERLGGDLRGLTEKEQIWLEQSKGGKIAYTEPALFSIARKLSRRARTQVENYINTANESTRTLSEEQKAFFRLPGAEEALRPKSKLQGILRGEQ